MVFSNKVLEAIAARCPTTLTELSHISGVGRDKLDRYGETVLALIKETLHQAGIEIRPEVPPPQVKEQPAEPIQISEPVAPVPIEPEPDVAKEVEHPTSDGEPEQDLVKEVEIASSDVETKPDVVKEVEIASSDIEPIQNSKPVAPTLVEPKPEAVKEVEILISDVEQKKDSVKDIESQTSDIKPEKDSVKEVETPTSDPEPSQITRSATPVLTKTDQDLLNEVKNLSSDSVLHNPSKAILKVVSDLDGLISVDGLIQLLTTPPGAVIPFSDHRLRGIYQGRLSKAEMLAEIENLVQEGQLSVTSYQRLKMSN